MKGRKRKRTERRDPNLNMIQGARPSMISNVDGTTYLLDSQWYQLKMN